MGARAKVRERVLTLIRKCERGRGLTDRELEERATLTGNYKLVRAVLCELLEEEELVRLSDGTLGLPPLSEDQAWMEELSEAWRRREEERGGGSTQ